ncbi:hypothetical protein AOLI_G00202480 [Acnodon oligacanthus]
MWLPRPEVQVQGQCRQREETVTGLQNPATLQEHRNSPPSEQRLQRGGRGRQLCRRAADPWPPHRGVPDHLPLLGGLHGLHGGLWTPTSIQPGAWPQDQAAPVLDTPLSHSERGGAA